MINFKVSGIAAGAAFVLSLIIGLLSGTAFSAMLFRAFVFALVFFALSGLGFWLVSRYLPELLGGAEADGGGGGGNDIDDFDISVPGSRVDISEDEAPVEGAFPQDASDALDDIAGSPSAGGLTGDAAPSGEPADSQGEFSQAGPSPLDQEKKNGYNQERDITDDIGSLVAPEDPGDTEALPDIGSIGEGVAEPEQSVEVESFEPPEPRSASSKKSTVTEDFHPRELAKGIRSVLKKDEKG